MPPHNIWGKKKLKQYPAANTHSHFHERKGVYPQERRKTKTEIKAVSNIWKDCTADSFVSVLLALSTRRKNIAGYHAGLKWPPRVNTSHCWLWARPTAPGLFLLTKMAGSGRGALLDNFCLRSNRKCATIDPKTGHIACWVGSRGRHSCAPVEPGGRVHVLCARVVIVCSFAWREGMVGEKQAGWMELGGWA